MHEVKKTVLRSRIFALSLVLGCLLGASRLAAGESENSLGIVLEKLGKDSALAKAGLEPGDILWAWRKLPSPASPQEAHEEAINSIFHWWWLAMEQAPRGTLELVGLHGGEKRRFVIEKGSWEDDAWPRLDDLESFRKKAQEYSTKEKTREVDGWWEAKAGATREWYIRSWLWAYLGKMRASRGAWADCYSAYQFAIAAAQDNFAKSLLWWEVGQLRQKQNEFDKAHDAYLEAQRLREQSGQPETLALAVVLDDLGGLAWQQGDLRNAEEFLQRSLQIRQRLAPGGLLVAQSLNDLGLVAADRRQLDKAADFLQRSLRILQELLPNSLALANSLNNLGMIAFNRRDLEQAAQFIQQALEIQQVAAPESLDVAQGLNNLASISAMRGDIRQAESAYGRALKIRQRLAPGSLSLADTLNNLGNVSMARGDLDMAMDYHQRAMELRRKLAPDSLQVAESLHNLGLIAERREEQQRAEDFHQRALVLRRQLAPDSLDVAGSLNSLAVISERRGDLGRAMQLHQQSLEISQRIAPESLDVALRLNNLGATAMHAGQLKKAEGCFRRALDIESRLTPEGSDAASSLGYLGELSGRREDWSHSVSFYQRAVEIRRVLEPGTSALAKSLHDLGAAYRKLDPRSLALAEDLFQQSVDTLELQLSRFGGSQDSRANFRAGFRVYYRDLLAVQLEQGRSTAAFQTLERSRARSFLEQLAERDTIFAVDIPEDLERERHRLAFQVDRAQQQLAKFSPGEQTKQIEEVQGQLRRLRDEGHDVEERIRRASPKLASLQYPHPLGLEAVRASLDPGTLLLSYSVGERDILLFSLSQGDDLRVDTLPIGEQDLREQIRALLASIGLHGRLHSHNFEIAARQLNSMLIEPAADRIAAAERLLILPDGPLHLLPWGALIRESPVSASPQGGKWQFLAEWKPFSIALSATVFAELKKYRLRPDRRVGTPDLAVFGDPLILHLTSREASAEGQDARVRSAMQRGFSFEPIPASRIEAQQIATLFPHTALYLGMDATEEHAKSLSRNTRIVHFATHTTLDERSPLDSAVVLSIPSKFEEGKENGLLQAWEVFEQVRLDADLVVLSACESGLGKELGGEGLIGLTRAFQYAGARSVMASLWKISDRTTAELMVRFYRHLKDGLPKDEALRAAQVEMIRRPIKVKNEQGEEVEIDASAPYYWAAFQIYGDWQ